MMEHKKKKTIFLLSIVLVIVLSLIADLSLEPFLGNLVKIAKSFFDVDPSILMPGSNIRVSTDNLTYANMCLSPLQPILHWNILSGTQVSYAAQVDNNGWLPKVIPSSFPSPEEDTSEIFSAASSYVVGLGKLAWDTVYYWQVAVKDNFGSWSGWTEADTAFRTAKHRWPSVNSFTWNPISFSANEEIQFFDSDSIVYGGTSKAAWFWTFQPDGTPLTSTLQNPVVYFASAGLKTITLQVTDSDGNLMDVDPYNDYTCDKTLTTSAKLGLPQWKEIWK